MSTETLATKPRGGICVSVAAPDTEGVLAAIKPVEKDVDAVEIRLDAMHEVSMTDLCEQVDLPLLFTNRAAWEGGMAKDPEKERIARLAAAAAHGASFVDLELKTEPDLREQLLYKIDADRTRMIISHHDFEKTPDSESLSLILRQQIESGAHIGKIVTMAHDHLDVLRVLNLQCEAGSRGFPLIAFCMGDAGRISRVLTLLLGGFMTYAAIDDTQATAPGQLSVRRLRESLASLEKNMT